MKNFGTRADESIETRVAAESVIERVYLAVEQLCTGRDDVRGRLRIAVTILLPLRDQDFPRELQDDFNWVIASATKYKSEYPQSCGDLESTVRRIRRSTGQRIAQRIFQIYRRLQDVRGFPLADSRDPLD